MKPITKTIAGISLILFFVFAIFSLCIGGDAIHGYTQDGHYYVEGGSNAVEVSQTIWVLNYISGIFGLGGILLVVVLGILERNRKQ